MNAENRISFSRIDFPKSGSLAAAQPSLAEPVRPLTRDLKRFLTGFFLVVVCVAVVWPILPRRYESTASVILRPTDDQGRLDSAQSLRQPLDDNAIQSEMDIIGSPTIASAVVAYHNLQNDPEFAPDPNRLSAKLLAALYRVAPIASAWFGDLRPVSEAELRDRLQKHLTVSRDRRSYTVKMGYWSSDPAKAAALTETLLKTYLSDQLSRKRGQAEQHSAWLVERVDSLRARYETSERAIRDFSLQADLADNVSLTSMEAQRDALAKEAGDLRDKLAKAATQGGSPQTGRSSTAASAATQAAETEIRGLEQREADVQDAIRKIRVDLADRRLATLKLDALRREAAIDKELLEGALVRLKEQGPRSSSSAGPGVEILARPDPALRPSFPNALLFLVGTLVAAVAAGIVMVWNPRAGGIRRSPTGR